MCIVLCSCTLILLSLSLAQCTRNWANIGWVNSISNYNGTLPRPPFWPPGMYTHTYSNSFILYKGYFSRTAWPPTPSILIFQVNMYTYKKCCSGKKLVDWVLSQSAAARSRQQVIAMWQALLTEGIIQHGEREKERLICLLFDETSSMWWAEYLYTVGLCWSIPTCNYIQLSLILIHNWYYNILSLMKWFTDNGDDLDDKGAIGTCTCISKWLTVDWYNLKVQIMEVIWLWVCINCLNYYNYILSVEKYVWNLP